MKLRFLRALQISIGLPMVLLLAAACLATWALWSYQQQTKHMLAVEIPLAAAVDDMYAQGLQMGQALRNIALDPANPKGHDNFAAATKAYEDSATKARGLARDAAHVAIIDQVAQLRVRQAEVQQRVAGLVKSDVPAALVILVKEETVVWREMRSRLLDLRKALAKEAEVAREGLIARGANAMTAAISIGLLACLMSIVMLSYLSRRVHRDLGGEPAVAAQAMHAIASGDLSTRVPVTAGDQTSLLAAVEDMARALRNLVGLVRSGVDEVQTASASLVSDNESLSDRTEQAASSLEQTAATMEQFAASIQITDEHVSDARGMAQQAADAASRGSAVFEQFVGTMSEISASSRRIADIIGVIDGIAFQTNILALNAAVEAARAGEQGRGFAVVATEVRGLAQRSATAAREIKTLIEESVGKVDSGTRQVGEAERWMKDIAGMVASVNEVMERIRVASRDQAQGIQQVNTAVVQLDQMTQHNAHMVEQGARSAQSMKQLAERLEQAVSAFRLRADAMQGVAGHGRV